MCVCVSVQSCDMLNGENADLWHAFQLWNYCQWPGSHCMFLASVFWSLIYTHMCTYAHNKGSLKGRWCQILGKKKESIWTWANLFVLILSIRKLNSKGCCWTQACFKNVSTSAEIKKGKLKRLLLAKFICKGQGGLACCNSWGRNSWSQTRLNNWTELNWK